VNARIPFKNYCWLHDILDEANGLGADLPSKRGIAHSTSEQGILEGT
jgi:hypothetical protein